MKLKILLLLTISLGALIGSCSYLPDPIVEDTRVALFENRDYIEITPVDNQFGTTGLIFYPGALVDPHAYVPLLSDFAVLRAGHKVVIAKMPVNLAVLDIKAWEDISEEITDIDQWVIGGHSLGGAMACSAVSKAKDAFVGLVLMAGYPAESVDLTDWNGAVLSLSASKDELATLSDIQDSESRLPPVLRLEDFGDFPGETTANQSLFFEIPGGNHAYFGSYGEQDGDGEATIPRTEQHTYVNDFMMQFFEINGF